eukprot:UN30869
MEDWGYGSSWMNKYENNAIKPCTPKANGGYPEEKTIYNDSQLRSVLMLIEAHAKKKPDEGILGSDENVFSPDNNGLISRLIRMCLLMTDVAQPYIIIRNIDASTEGVTVSWEVGGSYEVNSTRFTARDVDSDKVYTSQNFQGQTRWLNDLHRNDFTTQFSSELKLDGNGTYEITVEAVVDQHWITDKETWPNIKPQTHLINARTNTDWNHQLKYSVVNGQTVWTSDKMTINLDGSFVKTQREGETSGEIIYEKIPKK